MSKNSNVKKNFAYQMMYELLILILPFVTSPYIARVIGADGVGNYSYTYTIANYFVLFAMLGIKNYGNRAVAQARDDQNKLNVTFSNILFVHVVVSLICCICYILYILLFATEKVYSLIQFTVVIGALFDISWFYFGIEKFKLTVLRSTIIKIVNVICIFLFVKDSDDLWVYCLIMGLGSLISQLSLWVVLRKYVRILKPDKNSIKVHLKPMLVLFLPVIAISLYKYMDKIMIGMLSSKTQLGFYENAEKVVNMPVSIIGSFGTVMLPKMSNLASKSDDKTAMSYISQSMRYIMCLSFALSFGVASIGQTFAPVFWGDKFIASGPLIVGLSFTIPFMSYANIIRTQYLIPHSHDKEYLTSVIVGAVCNIILNSILIPVYGAMGATIGTLFAEISVCLVQAFVVRKELPVLSYCKEAFIFLITGIVMFFIVWNIGRVMNASVSVLILQVLCGVVVYGITAFIIFYRRKDAMLMNVIQKLIKH
ncbi:MAG: flippase [Ruminococcus sp.]|nr:flippase [Ruminococcus sp.]